jgi:hypothetical protein
MASKQCLKLSFGLLMVSSDAPTEIWTVIMGVCFFGKINCCIDLFLVIS